MMKKFWKLFLIVSIGWMIVLSACSPQISATENSVDQQLVNIADIQDWPAKSATTRLSPNADWFLNKVFDEFSRVSYQIISTEDPDLTLEQEDYLGYSTIGDYSWAPDSSAFVAIDFESPGRCGMNRILLVTLMADELITTVFQLPVEDCISVKWSSDGEHLVVYQKNTFYIITKDGQLEQDFIYEKPNNVGMSYLMNENGLIIFQDSEDGSGKIIKSIDLSNPENPEIINVIDDVQFIYIMNVRYGSDTVVFLEEGDNRIWLFDSVNNTLSHTDIFISGEVYRIDIVGEINKISVKFEEDDIKYLNIYDLTTGELEKSIVVYTYIGWYPDLGGFLIWSGTEEDGMYEIVN